MKFYCCFENKNTGEKRELICALNRDELKQVRRAREANGEEIALVTAAAFVMRSAYSELDAREWVHLYPPALAN